MLCLHWKASCRVQFLPVRVQCCFTSTETLMTIRDGKPRMATSTLTQLLNSENNPEWFSPVSSVLLYLRRWWLKELHCAEVVLSVPGDLINGCVLAAFILSIRLGWWLNEVFRFVLSLALYCVLHRFVSRLGWWKSVECPRWPDQWLCPVAAFILSIRLGWWLKELHCEEVVLSVPGDLINGCVLAAFILSIRLGWWLKELHCEEVVLSVPGDLINGCVLAAFILSIRLSWWLKELHCEEVVLSVPADDWRNSTVKKSCWVWPDQWLCPGCFHPVHQTECWWLKKLHCEEVVLSVPGDLINGCVLAAFILFIRLGWHEHPPFVPDIRDVAKSPFFP